MSKGPKGAADFLMPRANSARGKVLGGLPRSPARGAPPETPPPLPLPPLFHNRPPPPRVAGGELSPPQKNPPPPPRLKRAPWTAAGRSENLLVKRERGQMQRSPPPQPA